MEIFNQFNEILKHLNLMVFIGIILEMISDNSHLNFKGFFCYIFPSQSENSGMKLLDLILSAIIFSIIGDIILEPDSIKQALISGFGTRAVIKKFMNKNKEVKNEK